MIIFNILFLIFLIIASIDDIRNKSISGILVIAAGISLLIIRVFITQNILSILIDIAPALLLFFLAYFTNELIGYGDVAIIAIAFLVYGIWRGAEIILLGLMIHSIFAGILWTIGKIKMKDSLPFIPSILISCLSLYLFGIIRLKH